MLLYTPLPLLEFLEEWVMPLHHTFLEEWGVRQLVRWQAQYLMPELVWARQE